MILIPKFQNIVETSGTLSIVHSRGAELIEDRFYSNIVTTVGKKWLAARMKDTITGHTIPVQMSHMGVGGNGTVGAAVVKTTPAASATALTTGGTPALSELARVALTTAGGSFPQGYTGGLPNTSVITYAATFAAGTGTGAIIEAGIFNAASTGSMLCITSFDVVNKQAADTIAITWTINIQ
jgi:hypothetical protein